MESFYVLQSEHGPVQIKSKFNRLQTHPSSLSPKSSLATSSLPLKPILPHFKELGDVEGKGDHGDWHCVHQQPLCTTHRLQEEEV